ncbi:hypothetical protein RI129_000923 [Pyrocoelia pectoralis]|uniref:Uncharacterized protein n=1 Tax=Pyrocoelia pectoralis TaxID=417401 RepID=A0AAN7VWF2_9COLE
MEELDNVPNQRLLINLSSFAEGHSLAQLSGILSKMLTSEMMEDECVTDEFDMVLASDYNWRLNIYFKLLRKIKDTDVEMMDQWLEEKEPTQLHHWNIIEKESSSISKSIESNQSDRRQSLSEPVPISWTINDLAKSACLLEMPPKPVSFDDEQEMRRVYTLIYDTFRYKGILNQALNDISFYQLYNNMQQFSTRVWLLFFDLYHRSFKKRESAVMEQAAELLTSVGIFHIENALWEQRVKLAAAIAKLRIKNSALSLNDLLPKHLRDEHLGNGCDSNPVTCWINPNKTKSEREVITVLEKAMCLKNIDFNANLSPNSYKWDQLCPNFLAFHHSLRSILARSHLVQNHKLIVQDRSFCLGPATFGKVVRELELTGTVIQSHVNSPRTTAYLAMLLSKNGKINNLLVFGAGSRKDEYSNYLQEIGVKNVLIYSESLTDVPPQSTLLEKVIAVFATPPNSYSAINDPIDLVCSRGGDLSMLEILTESEITEEGKERVAAILDEQRKTLKYAMSRPQIQLVLYETHSELEVENDEMVKKSMKDINKLTTLKHAALQGKLKIEPSYTELLMQEINNNETIKLEISEDSLPGSTSKSPSIISKISLEMVEEFEKIYEDVVVPDCDIFDKPSLPSLCPNVDESMDPNDEGCYLALIQRKEFIKLDNKYMIQMAETRGLFGTSSTLDRSKGRPLKTKKQEKRAASPPASKQRRKPKQIEIERIAAPTQASTRQFQSSQTIIPPCPRNQEEQDQSAISKVPQSRRWWTETARHLTNLRQTLVNKNVVPNVKKPLHHHVSKHSHLTVDEIVAKTSQNNRIPLFPKLRLTRNLQRHDKTPLPVSVTLIKFPRKYSQLSKWSGI